MKNIHHSAITLAATAAALLIPGYNASANQVDLTTNASGSIFADVGGTALFERANTRPFGTGVIDPFLRLAPDGQGSLGNKNVEQAYNTDGRIGAQAPLDAKSDPNFTHSLQLGDLTRVSKNGSDYYFFELDANEPDSAQGRLLSIDNIRIYTAGVADGGDATTTAIDTLGILRFALNEPNVTSYDDPEPENWVKIDSSHNFSDGSGQSDMYAYIPVSAFAGAALTDFVYFYNVNGVHYEADGLEGTAAQANFEEWSTMTGGNPPPVPDSGSTVMLLGAALTGIGALRFGFKG